MRVAQRRIGAGVVGIEIGGALAEFARLVVAVTRVMRQRVTTAEDVLVCREVAGRFCQHALPFEAGEFDGRRADDASGDLVLHGENVVDLGIVCVRPNEASRRCLGQFDIRSNAIAHATDAAREQITRIQKASDISGGCIRILERETGRFGDDKQVRETRERDDDVRRSPRERGLIQINAVPRNVPVPYFAAPLRSMVRFAVRMGARCR